jgi:hypothetical protein
MRFPLLLLAALFAFETALAQEAPKPGKTACILPLGKHDKDHAELAARGIAYLYGKVVNHELGHVLAPLSQGGRAAHRSLVVSAASGVGFFLQRELRPAT